MKKNEPIIINSRKHEYIIQNMSCSWGFHSSSYYIYKGILSKELMFIAEQLNCTILESGKDTFKFTARGKGCLQRIMFKILRYVRNNVMQEIIHGIYNSMKQGVNPYTSVYIGHFKNNLKRGYYSTPMDILSSFMYFPIFYTKKTFETTIKNRSYINYIFSNNTKKNIFPKEELVIFTDLVSNDKYKEAEQFLIKLKKLKK